MCNNCHYTAQVIIAEEVIRCFAQLNLKPMFRLKVILATTTKLPLTWRFPEIDFSIFYRHIESYQKVNPAKKNPVSVSMILKRRTFLSGIITNKAIVQTHGPHLRFILKSLLVVIFSAGSDQPNCNWHADQTSDTLRKSSAGRVNPKILDVRLVSC